jgi:putative DNA primase/helicase
MSAHSTSGAYKATKLPPADLGTSMEDAHDPELRDDDSGPDEQIAGTPDNVVDISYMMAPGAGARERAQVLALLEPHEYDQIAKAQAKEIGCKVSTLTRYVQEEQRKLKQQKATDRPGWSVDPSTEAVNGAALFHTIEATIAKHLILPKGAAAALAIWVGHSWTAEASNHTPLLALLSPEPECGKSTTIKVLTRLCRNPKPASNISPAAIYYAIEKYSPLTLFIDEMDSQPDGGEACRNILNSGHERELAYVTRTEEIGGQRQLVEFNTFCPKVVACIGKLKPTLMSRSIIIWLRRKRPDEAVVGLAESDGDFAAIRSSLARWAEDNVDDIGRASPKLPEAMANRSADNWRELFRIAEVIGGGWPDKLTAAASALIGARKLDTATAGTMLLADIRSIFETERAEVLQSETIVGALEKMEDRPWPEWKNGKPMTAQQMAKVLEPFDIGPRQHWTDRHKIRGYALAQFLDVFQIYLPGQNEGSRPSVPEAGRLGRPVEPAENRHPESAEKPIPTALPPLRASQKVGRTESALPGTDMDADTAGVGTGWVIPGYRPFDNEEFPDIPDNLDRRKRP